MTKKHQKIENQQEQKQPTTPAVQVELTDEALGQGVGGVIAISKSTGKGFEGQD